jgi:protein-L-isoaspartate O-methyltransferase
MAAPVASAIALVLSALLVFPVAQTQPSPAEDRHAAPRARMLAEIAAMARATGGATGRPVLGEAVMNIEVRIGDGYNGWPEAAPFDSIIVTAAPADIPRPLIDQLKPGGRMVVPVGRSFDGQYLLLVYKQRDGTSVTRRTLPVRFVPLTRDRGAK